MDHNNRKPGALLNMLYGLIPGSVRFGTQLGYPHIYKNHFYVKIFDLGGMVANVNKIHMHACSARCSWCQAPRKYKKKTPSRTQRAASIARINR